MADISQRNRQMTLDLNAVEEVEGLVDSIIFASDNGDFSVFRYGQFNKIVE